MTQYLMAVYPGADDLAEWEAAAADPTHASAREAEMTELFAAVDRYNEELRAAGAWVFAGGLHPPSTATVVAAHEGNTVITDGPYAETREQLGGLWVIEAPDLDAALAWATKASVACQGPVEVRPFEDS